MVEKYNSLDIYIFKLYEKKYDNEYYDESIDLYVTDTYFKLKGFCLGIIKDQDKIFDIINRKEISLLNVNAKNNEEFALMDEYVKFNSFLVDDKKSEDMSILVISEIWKSVKKGLIISERNNFDKLYYFQYPHLEKGYYPLNHSLMYGNDYEEYVDEYKEYRKRRLLLSKNNKSINYIM